MKLYFFINLYYNFRCEKKMVDEAFGGQKICIFCDIEEQDLPQSSVKTTSKLNSWAIELQDDNIVNRISNHARTFGAEIGVFYHKPCFIKFTRRYESHLKIKTSDNKYQADFNDAVDKLIIQIQSAKSNNVSEPTLFKLSDLTNSLHDLLNEMGYADANVHRTRLKDLLISKVNGLRSELVGRDVVLLFDEDVKHLIKHYWAHKCEDDYNVIYRKAAMKLRKEILVDNEHNFDGSLQNSFTQENSEPEETIKFLNVILYGESSSTTKIACNLAQLIKFNSKKVKRGELTVNTRHVLCREQPLPLYHGLLLHASTHQKHLIKELADLGMTISYSRILEIETAITNKICDLYSEDSRICPPNLELNVFTTSAIDNIDHNPSSNGATYSFHGTGISLIQHPTTLSVRKAQFTLTKQDFEPKPIKLPQNYYKIDHLLDEDGEVPLVEIEWNTDKSEFNAIKSVQDWLDSSNNNHDDLISWASFHSRQSSPVQRPITNTNMLPLLKDSINSNSVVAHCLNIIMASTSKINPTQIPVVTGDEPVYARIKTIQWLYPEKYGEDKLVVMLGEKRV